MQLSALKPGRRPVAVVLQNPHNFKIGTTVRHREPAAFGVIKWMGILPDDQKMAYAGLEMVCKFMIEHQYYWICEKEYILYTDPILQL